MSREKILPAVPAWTGNDAGVFVFLNWTEYFDGTNAQGAPLLPSDLIAPFDLYERVTGTTGPYTPMDQVFNGLQTANPAGGATLRDVLNRMWEWRGERIYMPGTTGQTDIRLRYAGLIADFLIGAQDVLAAPMTVGTLTMNLISGATIANGAVGSGTYVQIDQEIMLVTAGGGTPNQTVSRAQQNTLAAAHAAGATVYVLGTGIAVPIMRSLNSFAWYMCSELARSRGDLDAGQFDQFAMEAAQEIWNRDYRQGKTLYKRAELGKMPGKDTRQMGANMPAGPQQQPGV